MKLVTEKISQKIDFESKPNYILTIENPQFYRQIVQELYNECENNIQSSFILSDKTKIIPLYKNVLFLLDYINLDINNRKIINEINSCAREFLINSDFTEDFSKLNEVFIKINEEIVEKFSFKVDFDYEFGFDKFIKSSNYRLKKEENLLENILSYINVYTSLMKTKLIIFVNASAFLSKEEISLLAKELNYIELCCLFIESTDYVIDEFTKIIIDNDLCEI